LEENDLTAIGLSEDRFVLHDGSYWVPIETTQLGKNFFSAWQMALSEVKAAQEKGTAEFVLISNAHQSYPPVTIIEEEKEQTPYPEEKVNQTFPPVLLKLQQEKYEGQINRIKEEIKANPIDHMLLIQMGMIHVEGGKPEEGKKLFESLLKEDEPLEVQAAAKNNLGNISYINGKYDEAAKLYAEARTISQEDGGILINQARAAWRLNDQESAKKYLQEAKEKVKEWREYSSDIPVELYPK
jgi:tetratricopeptide (TPR) repeat protein